MRGCEGSVEGVAGLRAFCFARCWWFVRPVPLSFGGGGGPAGGVFALGFCGGVLRWGFAGVGFCGGVLRGWGFEAPQASLGGVWSLFCGSWRFFLALCWGGFWAGSAGCFGVGGFWVVWVAVAVVLVVVAVWWRLGGGGAGFVSSVSGGFSSVSLFSSEGFLSSFFGCLW